jgi:hypothetical protein
MSEQEPTAITPVAGTETNLLDVADAQAGAIKAAAEFGTTFGTTVVTEAGQLARYMARVLGTAPHDAVGLIMGDPLHFVRAATAQSYDHWLTNICERRKVTETQPVSPSLAIPHSVGPTMKPVQNFNSFGRN